MSDAGREPFGREEALDKPGIIGARWWQRSLEAAPDAMTRRRAIQGIVIAGGALVLISAGLAIAGSASSSSDYRTENRGALDMQREFGWSFGATAEQLTFDGESKRPFDREALARLADDLRPARAEHAPWYVPTLFQSPSALPRSVPKEETPSTPLKQALVPIFTPAMDTAYRRGRALAALFKGMRAGTAIVVDLPGPEAIAFAAGASAAFDPVFALDNWPHPRGVVPAHLALAAAAYYQPLFAKHASGPDPMIVLDRRRLNAYSDDASQFDNRHLARLPGAAALKARGLTHVLYVAPSGSDRELDDLNDDLVLYAKSGLDVRLVGEDAFGPDPSAAPVSSPTESPDDEPRYFYGSRAESDAYFWIDYPFVKLPAKAKPPIAPSPPPAGPGYRPFPRTTPFSGGAPGTAARPKPVGFGTVPVIISVATGLVLGAKLFRSGSWNRSSGGWGG